MSTQLAIRRSESGEQYNEQTRQREDGARYCRDNACVSVNALTGFLRSDRHGQRRDLCKNDDVLCDPKEKI